MIIKNKIGEKIKNGIKNIETKNHFCLNIFFDIYIYIVEPNNIGINISQPKL